MRRQAERWGAELHQEDVEYVDVKNRPFTVQSSERKVMLVVGVILISSSIVSINAFFGGYCCISPGF